MSSLLETIIQTTSTFMFQSMLILCVTLIVIYGKKLFSKIDLLIAYYFQGMFTEYFEKRLKASVRIISETSVKPDPNIPLNNKNGDVTEICAVEAWLTHFPIDYSLFFDYYIDPNEAQASLSRLLSKIPVIGGVYKKINDTTIGIDHSKPCISFMHTESDDVPSIDDKDVKNNNWYINYTRGANTGFPFPEGYPTFKVTLTHYPNPKKKGSFCSLLSVGCSHAMCDGEAFFLLMRCWSNEMRGIKDYQIPEFTRNKLIIKPDELKQFKPQTTLLGKHFDYMTRPTSWLENAIWPCRRYVTRTWNFSQEDIEKLKKSLQKGSHGEKLKNMNVSTNDIITALFWKLRATLNNGYYFTDPIMCGLIVNTRAWLPDRIPKCYFGNALSFLLLSKTRGELIDADFSEVVYWIRDTIRNIKKEDIETDLHWYYHITKHGVDILHRFNSRWAIGGHNYHNARLVMDRDMMISNLAKLPTMSVDFGKGNVFCTRFNHQEDCAQMAYFFKTDIEEKNFEFYTAIPESDVKFFDKYNIKDPDLDWNEIRKEWVYETRYFIRSLPFYRGIIFDPKSLFDNRTHVKFMKW